MALVRKADPDRYLSVLYAPEEKRPALYALYAFNAEIASVRERIHDPLPGEIRLQWWRDVLSDAGGDAGAAQGNPVAQALLAAIGAHHLPVKALLDYLDARLFDLYDDPMPARTDLEGYCGETASAIIQLACLVLDAGAAARTATLAGHAGCAQAITGLLRLLPVHRRRGQCYVPGEILAAAGTSRDEFVSSDMDDRAGRAIVGAMTALAREHDAAFLRGAGDLPSALRPAFLAAAIAPAYLDRIERGKVDPLSEVADISALRRHWLMFGGATRGWRREGGE